MDWKFSLEERLAKLLRVGSQSGFPSRNYYTKIDYTFTKTLHKSKPCLLAPFPLIVCWCVQHITYIGLNLSNMTTVTLSSGGYSVDLAGFEPSTSSISKRRMPILEVIRQAWKSRSCSMTFDSHWCLLSKSVQGRRLKSINVRGICPYSRGTYAYRLSSKKEIQSFWIIKGNKNDGDIRSQVKKL